MKSSVFVLVKVLACILLPGGSSAQKESNGRFTLTEHDAPDPTPNQVGQEVSTKAPLECMCRPCTGIEDANVIPQELTAFADDGALTGYFQKSQYKSSE